MIYLILLAFFLTFFSVAPDQTASSTTKDPSLCELPGCCKCKRRNSKDGGLYDFCGRTHALEAEKKGIQVAHGTCVYFNLMLVFQNLTFL